MRNKNITAVILLSLAITAAASVGAFLIDAVCGGITLAACLALTAVFIIYNIKRQKKINELSDYLTTIVNGTASLSVPDNEEGELSILQNNIYKTAKKLQTQSELLYKDKNYLADSLADISHQLKTPITSMTVMTDLLRQEDLDEAKRREFLENIDSQLKKMQWMLLTLLKISKFDADTVTLKSDPVELALVIKKSLEPFLIQAELRGITINPRCDAVKFSGDLLWTTEAVQNIIKNCLEHMDEGGRLEISGSQTPIYAELKIKDDGCGIAKEDLPHIFERFYRGKNSSPDSVGIGLALSKSIFNRENAVVDVESELGKGTTFIIRFYKLIV